MPLAPFQFYGQHHTCRPFLPTLLSLGMVLATVWMGSASANTPLYDIDPNTDPNTQHHPSVFDSSPQGTQPPPVHTGNPTLKASVEAFQHLPEAMYGGWTVTATLVETNDPHGLLPVVNEIWELLETDTEVILRNATNGAQAAVNVQSVQGNTARFVHQSHDSRFENMVLVEEPLITVDGDRMTGFSLNREYTYNRDGRVARVRWGKYKLEAVRISGARLKWGNPHKAPSLEVAPVQTEEEFVRSQLPPLQLPKSGQ